MRLPDGSKLAINRKNNNEKSQFADTTSWSPFFDVPVFHLLSLVNLDQLLVNVVRGSSAMTV